MRLSALVLVTCLLTAPTWPATIMAGGVGRFQPDPKLPADLGVPYVVLTTEAMAPAFQRFVEWKRATGMPAQIVTIDGLAKNPYYAGVDLPERMYELLKDLRLNWRTRWVLLGGDVEIVPNQRVRAYRMEHGGDRIPCDAYFSDVLPEDRSDADVVERYGWNGNGDRFIGEASKDGFDLVPELCVGRLPVETPKEAETYFEKYFEYVGATGADLSHLDRALVVGANQFRESQTRLAEVFREAGGEGYSAKLVVEEKPDPVKPIVDELNRGYAFFDFLCHGCPFHFWAADDHTSFTMAHVQSLKNQGKYPVVFANSCNTLEFDKDDCFGESWLLQPKGGGIAYVGYTSVSFQSTVNVEMYRLLFGGECPQLGRALMEAKATQRQDTWVGQLLDLLGDPEMWVRTRAPKALRVSEDRLALNVPGRVTVTSADGKPVRSARVLLEAPAVYVVGTTDENGVAKLGPPPRPGSARLSVLAQNGARFEKKVTIDAKPPQGVSGALPRPALTVDDAAPVAAKDGEEELHGNAQKDLNPGETVRLVFTWALAKDQRLPRGTFALAIEEDPFVQCLTATPAVEGSSAAFVVHVNPRVPSWHQAWMTLAFQDEAGGDPWVWRFRQPVEGAAVSLATCAIDDSEGNKDRRIGWEDAGKKVRFSVGLFNSGTQKANGLKLTLETKDPAVTLLRREVAFGVLPCQDLVEAKDRTFEMQLAADYDGHALEFTLVMEDDRRNRWTSRIVFTVPPAPPILPRAEAGTRLVNLSWTPGGSSGVVGYHVYRASSEKGSYQRLTEQPVRNATRYPDTAVRPSTAYFYVVRSVTADGLEGPASSPVRAHTLTPLPKGAEK